MIRMNFPKLAIQRARLICENAERTTSSQPERDRLCQDSVGLTHRYLSRIGKRFRSPSNRVLLSLGLELVVRDPRTGEEEVVPLLLEEA
jgi:hypothetical protein